MKHTKQPVREDFRQRRQRLQELVLSHAGTNTKRFLQLDTAVYRAGALPAKTKELLGLVASLVLRCDDCITYHLDRCRQAGVSDAEFDEASAVGLVVGGSVVIPHLRRAFETWFQKPPAPTRSD